MIFKRQFRFRKNHSTVNAMQLLIADILDSFQENFSIACIFMDLRKAFDMVSHHLILSKLEKMGIQGTLLKWFSSYLDSRLQYTHVNGIDSDLESLPCGVPQGSLLSVLLFQLHINDMHSCLKHCNSILYPDDTTIYVAGRNLHFVKCKLQADMNSVSSWLRSNLLILNVKKIKLIYFNRDYLNPNISISIDGKK